jgi:predicted acylesterase/phospholipase RssA
MDTLILSAVGIKGIYYIGVYMSLLEHNIINSKTLKHIICCSSGCIFGLCILLDYSIDFIYKITDGMDMDKFINYEDLIDVFSDNGLFTIDKVENFYSLLIYHKFNVRDITFKELYEKTNKEYIVKVYNYTDTKTEYLSYINNPDLSVIKAISMSCCIPIFFKPIKYNDKLYIDGGVTGPTPDIKDEKYKNNITIKICNNIKHDEEESIFNYINNLLIILVKQDSNNSKYEINIPCIKDMSFANFQIEQECKKEMIDYAKLFTDIHIYKYL